MNTKQTIKKILVVGLWLIIGAGMITLLAAAMKKQQQDQCSDYEINIKGATKNLFVDKSDIVKVLVASTNGKIKGQPRSNFNLRKLEQVLEDNVWVRDAELYFDNKEVLHINISEREPVARVFNTANKSFYIDQDEKKMPLSDRLSATVPVFTGFPAGSDTHGGNAAGPIRAGKDSALLHELRLMAEYINRDSFWTAQVAQVNINEQREFEMIPLVGNHIVKLGDGENIAEKFHRLYVFYSDVLSKTGFDRYKTIDVQYRGQVVASRGFTTKVDSLQLRRNVEKLLQQARDMQYDTAIAAKPVAPNPLMATETSNDEVNTNEPVSMENVQVPATTIKTNITTTKPIAVKPVSPSPVSPKPHEKKQPVTKPVKREISSPARQEPKAVMPKRDT